MPRIQIPTASSGGSWSWLATAGAATARRPRAIALARDGAQRPMTKPSTDRSKRRGSNCPERCATTTGQITPSVKAHSGTPGTKAQAANAPTAIAARIGSSAESDGSVTSGDDRDQEREGRNQPAHLVGFGPGLTKPVGHIADGSAFRRPRHPCALGVPGGRQRRARHIDTWFGTASGISISPEISKPNRS